MKKIVIINTLYPPIQVGGAEKSVSLLATSLARRGYDVAVICLHEKPSASEEHTDGVRIIRLPLDNIYWPFGLTAKKSALARISWHIINAWNFKAARRVSLLLDEIIPDVVHTNNLTGFSISAWWAIKRRKIPLVHTLRDYSLVCSRSTLFRSGSVCEHHRCIDCATLTMLNKPATALVDRVVSNSSYVLQAHKRYGLFSKTDNSVIYNVADTVVVDEKRSSDGHTFTFGFIGRVEPEKGIEIVLEATKLMVQKKWRLKIAGNGLDDYVTKLKRRYTNPNIEWVGFVSSGDFYESIDTTVIASIWPEPLPRTLIESFAYGKKAICARSGGIPEIACKGSNVALYDAFDSAALAGLMDKFVETASETTHNVGVNLEILKEFREDAVVDKYIEEYILANKAS